MLIITNEDVEKCLQMRSCVDALETMYRDFGLDEAVEMPRQDGVTATSMPGAVHGLKTMAGSLPSAGVGAVRINSDIVRWPVINGIPRRTKIPLSQGSRYNGLVLLFGIDTGELLCIFNDGYVQKTRVGASSGVAARAMSRPDARKVGVIGSGWQATGQVEAMAAVRALEQVRVYSPNPERRANFASEMSLKTGVEVIPVDSPEAAVRAADIIISATNSAGPTVDVSWLRPGVHVTCVRAAELPREVLSRCDRVVVNTQTMISAYATKGFASEIPEFVNGGYALADSWHEELVRFPELKDVIAGKVPGRADDREVTCYYNFKGLGLQFASMGALIYAEAKERGYGVQVDDTLFSQLVHP